MSTDTQKVDVLAVMDEVIDDREFSETVGTLREARAAVAELVAASGAALNELRAYISDCESYEAPELVDELVATTDRFAAALTRVGGVACDR